MSDSLQPYGRACHAPLFVGFCRQEYWNGLPCPSPRDLPNPGIKPTSLMFPALAGRFFTTSATWKTPISNIPFSKLSKHRKRSIAVSSLAISSVGRKKEAVEVIGFSIRHLGWAQDQGQGPREGKAWRIRLGLGPRVPGTCLHSWQTACWDQPAGLVHRCSQEGEWSQKWAPEEVPDTWR